VSGFIADDKQWALPAGHRESLLAGKSFTVILYDELAIRSPRIQSLPEVRQLGVISWAVFSEPRFDVRCWPPSKAGITPIPIWLGLLCGLSGLDRLVVQNTC
jgi:hypothetical protein